MLIKALLVIFTYISLLLCSHSCVCKRLLWQAGEEARKEQNSRASSVMMFSEAEDSCNWEKKVWCGKIACFARWSVNQSAALLCFKKIQAFVREATLIAYLHAPVLFSFQIRDRTEGGRRTKISWLMNRALDPRWKMFLVRKSTCSEKFCCFRDEGAFLNIQQTSQQRHRVKRHSLKLKWIIPLKRSAFPSQYSVSYLWFCAAECEHCRIPSWLMILWLFTIM